MFTCTAITTNRESVENRTWQIIYTQSMTPEERFTKIENAIHALVETQAKHEMGIRDLIAVNRTCVDSIQQLTEIQKRTDAQVNVLVTTVQQHEGKMEEL